MLISRKWKIILTITFIVFLLSLYTIQTTPFENSQRKTQGWIIKKGDTVSYESFVNSNASVRTVVDEILNVYEYNKCELDTWGYRNIKVRVEEVPTNLNITQIALEIISFSGPVKIKQYVGNAWKERTELILPFFVPIGFWDDLLNSFKKVVNGIVSWSYSWVGEYTYTLSWVVNNSQYTLQYTWDEEYGVLQGAVINVTVNGETDSFEMHLNGQNLSAESFSLNELQIFLIKALLLVGFFSFPVAVGIFMGIQQNKKKKKEKQFEDEEYIRRNISEILRNWDEIKRNYILLWLGLNVAAFIIGFSSFIHLFYILSSTSSATIVHISVFIWIILAASLGAISLLYKRKFTKYINRHKVTGEEISAPLVTYIVGFLFALLYFGEISFGRTPSLIGQVILISLFAALLLTLIIFYLIINPWRGLNDIKIELENLL